MFIIKMLKLYCTRIYSTSNRYQPFLTLKAKMTVLCGQLYVIDRQKLPHHCEVKENDKQYLLASQ